MLPSPCNLRPEARPPPSWHIDALMTREQQSYYVGLLKAAELHGAGHQAVMEFQVVSRLLGHPDAA